MQSSEQTTTKAADTGPHAAPTATATADAAPARGDGASGEAEAKSKRTLSVSDAAVQAIRAQLAKRGTPEGAIRVGIRGGGCSGFSYVIEFEDKPPRSGDLVLEFAEPDKATVRVFCDKKSILYLGGSVLDWEKTLMFQGFKFKNPHEATRCGCGHSFTVA
ncbi:HesB/IscA family protein [Sorangium atrum]|uniref:Iron-sulfur cluster assembly accessory protein n=1 Tax=Sorangium atrum TaxID=2995308 RepID=A0ABT5CDZ8_9BACT|nr:iron-sulfur cluster assembly accessory protein [Sorangium aterium]MDC0684635.1 iron-sulfur cluster assembly accessory protein [Sorangium aterium]